MQSFKNKKNKYNADFMLDIKQEIPSILNLRTQALLKINRVPLLLPQYIQIPLICQVMYKSLFYESRRIGVMTRKDDLL